MQNKFDLALALEYPYDVPLHSYRVDVQAAIYDELEDLKVVACEGTDASDPRRYDVTLASSAGILRLNKVSVIAAAGSNASPAQLIRKYSGTSVQTIYCLRTKAANIASVYSAHLTAYGAVAACLVPLPGAEGSLFLNFLDENALQMMHETERHNYEFAKLEFGLFREHFCNRTVDIYYYKSLHGPLLSKSNTPVLLNAFDFQASQTPRLSERQVLTAVSSELACGTSLENFVEHVVHNAENRVLLTKKLKQIRI
jgi:hypothetical protein